MKKLLALTMAVLMVVGLPACSRATASGGRSESGSSAPASHFSSAEKIQVQTGADIFEITTVNGYSDDYDTVLNEAQAEQRENARPELNGHVENMDGYDVVYLGYPNWWGDMPMALYTFLEAYDLSGKTIVPFVTSGGSGSSGTINTIRSAQPDATAVDGLALDGSSAASSDTQISQWLNNLELAE